MAISTQRVVNGVEVPPAGTYTFDPAHTAVEFIGTHMFTKTRGRFTSAEGAIVISRLAEKGWRTAHTAASQTDSDQLAAGVIDPLKVTRSAVENAASIAR